MEINSANLKAIGFGLIFGATMAMIFKGLPADKIFPTVMFILIIFGGLSIFVGFIAGNENKRNF